MKTQHILLGLASVGGLLLLWNRNASAAPATPFVPAPPEPQPQPAPAPAPQVIHVPDMPPSDWRPSDPNVSWVQARLNELGFPAGPVDGLMGDLTRAGIRAYQASMGFPETGVVDADTLMGLQGHKAAERPLYQNP